MRKTVKALTSKLDITEKISEDVVNAIKHNNMRSQDELIKFFAENEIPFVGLLQLST
jgi:hypothetical protein